MPVASVPSSSPSFRGDEIVWDGQEEPRGAGGAVHDRAGISKLLGAQRKVDGVLEDDLLALFAQDETKELREHGIERFTRRLVGGEVEEAAQGVGGAGHVLVGGAVERTV